MSRSATSTPYTGFRQCLDPLEGASFAPPLFLRLPRLQSYRFVYERRRELIKKDRSLRDCFVALLSTRDRSIACLSHVLIAWSIKKKPCCEQHRDPILQLLLCLMSLAKEMASPVEGSGEAMT